MTTAKKLWVGFGLLISLFIINSLIIAACLNALRTHLDELVEIHEPNDPSPADELAHATLNHAAEARRFVNDVSVATLFLLGVGLVAGIGTAMLVGRAIWRTEKLLRITLSNIGDAIVTTDPEGRVTSMNPVAQTLAGWTQEEAAGKPLRDILETAIQLPDRSITQATESGIAARFATSVLRAKDGTQRPIEIRTDQILDASGTFLGKVLVFRDIAERQQIEAARERRERERAFTAEVGAAALAQSGTLRALLQRCAETAVRYPGAALARIWIFNADKHLLELQASAGVYTHLDGPDSRVSLGELGIGLIARDRKPTLTNDVQNERSAAANEWARSEGMTAFAGYPLVTENRLVGVLALFAFAPLAPEVLDLLASMAPLIAQGIARRSSEQEREHLLASEQAARGAAERAAKAKDEFLATLSHELRTPLQAIVGWTAVLRDTIPSDHQAALEAAEVIERNARAQAHLIDDLLDMSRIISGKIQLDMRRVDLTPIVEAALETVRPAARERGVRLHKRLREAGAIKGDPTRLQQIFWNMLTNAIKFTPGGGRVHIDLGERDSAVEITVTDTGQGIAPEFLPYVFEEFRQADASTTRRHGGLGLGMAIVKYLVEVHGGTVEAESPGTGKGATFRVTLPLAGGHPTGAEDENAHSESTVITPEKPDSPTLQGIKVLVVEDARDTREMIKRVLEDHQAEVVTAESASEALQVLEQSKPHVLISDIGLPDEDGYELIRHIRALAPERGGEIPAAALTALVRSTDRKRSLAAGFQVHISKPVEPSELVDMVSMLARVGRRGERADVPLRRL